MEIRTPMIKNIAMIDMRIFSILDLTHSGAAWLKEVGFVPGLVLLEFFK